MDTLNTSLRSGTVCAWEESIWLDRREDGHPLAPECRSRLARLRKWLRHFRARMQLGPPGDEGTWLLGNPDERF